MKILHLESGKHLYGGAKQVVYLLKGLQERGHSSVLLCHIDSAIRQEFKGDPLIDVIPLRLNGELDVFSWFSIARQIHFHEPDLVHVHSRRGADIWGALAAQSRNVPAVCSRRVDNTEGRRFSRWKYRKFSKVIAISDGIRDVLLKQTLAAEHVVTVHSAVDTTEYQPVSRRKWLLDTFSLPDNALVIGSFAQMIPRKGQAHLIEAARDLREAFPTARYLLFGKGPMLEEYRSLAVKLGVEDIVLFPGFTDQVHEILPSIDILAHPADKEGLGVILLQAGACGIPIVAGRAGGMPEVVNEGVNGFLMEPGSTSALTGHLGKLLASEALRHQMGEAGRRHVCQYFSIHSMVEGNLRVYRDLLGS